MQGAWTIRNVPPAVIRTFRVAAVQRGMTLAQYLAWLAGAGDDWNHATCCGGCGGDATWPEPPRPDEYPDGCHHGCPHHEN